MKLKLAVAVRVITTPPFTIFAVLTFLFALKGEVIGGILPYILSVLFLSVIPALAYPIQPLVPKYKDKGRDGQRRLAFVTTAIGYLFGFIYGLTPFTTSGLSLIFTTYFISVIILTLINKLTRFHASGHACGAIGPLVLLAYMLGGIWILPAAVLAVGIVWSSIVTKSHTPSELCFGALTSISAFLISLFIYSI